MTRGKTTALESNHSECSAPVAICPASILNSLRQHVTEHPAGGCLHLSTPCQGVSSNRLRGVLLEEDHIIVEERCGAADP
ncbi:MAG: hypothetical protein NTX88_10670 [Candidatus Atribacteria bacterium]|nr:hypothetical protein [Candidatus Atribacteria bacterium]